MNDDRKRLIAMRWGLVPSWATDPTIGSRMINARAETLAKRSAFKEALATRRCLILADGFYEWQKREKLRIPLLVRLKSDRPFAFAGLYDVWNPPLGEPLTTCTIVTTEPNDVVVPIHDRMPVILPREVYDLWLDQSVRDHAALIDLLAPYPADEMEAYTVSTLVNSVNNDSPSCIEPASIAETGNLFER